uniref:(northern house mosquito) hypothetical protein n=1 Tax=Culex pipiens TaxID=7175 RepID=A0A8D8CK87_CULPI
MHKCVRVLFCCRIKSKQQNHIFLRFVTIRINLLAHVSKQNDESGSSPSTTKSRTLHDTNNNNIITKQDDSESGPVSNVLHLVVDFVKGAYPLFPALVAHFQFDSWAFSLLTLVATLALVVYLQLRLINRD